MADSVSVLFPWGSLLRAVAGGDPAELANLRSVCTPGAEIEVVTALDAMADSGELARLGMAEFSFERMAAAWRAAGFEDVAVCELPADHAYQTTWWRKIRQRSERRPMRLRAKAP